MSLAVGVLLFVAGVVAGFVNTVAGAGSLLTVPALLFAGLPAGEANATNRVAVMAQSVSGGGGFVRGGWLETSSVVSIAVPAVAGAGLGAVVATALSDEVLVVVLLVTMVAVGVQFAFGSRSPVEAETGGSARSVRESPGGAVLLFGGGFYGGLVQSGVGIVLLAILGGALGYDPVRANAMKLVITGVFTVVALAVFVVSGLVRWGPGLVLAAGSVVGATAGVKVAVRRGQGLVRAVVLVMVGAVVVQQSVLLVRG